MTDSEKTINSASERNRQAIVDDLVRERDPVRRRQLLQELLDYFWTHRSERAFTAG